MSAETKKIPEPIMAPTTTIVESNSPSERLKPCSVCSASWVLPAI